MARFRRYRSYSRGNSKRSYFRGLKKGKRIGSRRAARRMRGKKPNLLMLALIGLAAWFGLKPGGFLNKKAA